MPEETLGQRLLRFVHATLENLEATSVPGLRLPAAFAGHLVRSDTRADLMYVCALLVACGAGDVSGVDLRVRAQELLSELNTDQVEGFFAYRVAEAVDLLGGLAALSPHGQECALRASRSPRLLREAAADISALRPNFVVVAARCVFARRCLGGVDDHRLEDAVAARVASIFADADSGWINDGRGGELHFDIYTPEMYLLAEPFHAKVTPHWLKGLTRVVADLEKLGQPYGVVCWGRSIGPLAIAMSIELAVLCRTYALDVDRAWWEARAHDAASDLEDWFRFGLVNAHQFRTSDPYRGPARRLQLTFDLLGKLLWSAWRLRDTDEPTLPLESPKPIDALLRLPKGAAMWAYRSDGLSFVLPLMDGQPAGYVQSPRAPGLFEQPVQGYPLLVPAITTPNRTTGVPIHHVPDGPPAHAVHEQDRLVLRQVGWVPLGLTPPTDNIAGARHAAYHVRGRTLEVHEHLQIDGVPPGSALTLAVGEAPGRPLRFECDLEPAPVSIETTGMAEWRSHWSELQRVHQSAIPLEETNEIRFRWSVTRQLIVATTEPDHKYSRMLYNAISDVSIVSSGASAGDLARRLRGVDLLHIAWPERWVGVDVDATKRTIAQIRASGVRIVWTQHNLLPHRDRSIEARRVYSLWAEAADGVIHHSYYGKRIALATYNYERAKHYVIRHGHWGSCFPTPAPNRREVEASEGWPAAEIRLAIIGQPRQEKQLQSTVDAFSQTDRRDLQLVARLSADTRVPRDSRIVASYGHLEADRYYRRLTAVDGVLLPFIGDTMLTTGTAFDCIGGGIAAVASPWGYLRETFGSAAVWYSGTHDDLVECLSSLTYASLRHAGEAAQSLQAQHSWERAGQQTARAFEEVASV